MNKVKRPSYQSIQAAARVLDETGRHHHWWPNSIPDYENLDPIGKDEFEAIVEQILIAAQQAD